MLRKLSVMLVLVFTSFFLLACGNTGSSNVSINNNPEGQSQTELSRISIATASTAGHFYPIGVAMADVMNRNFSNVTTTAEETGGSRVNMGMIQNGEVEIAMAAGDVALPAYKGEEPFSEKVNMLMGWKIFDDAFKFVALKSSGISTMEDLKGKTIGLGQSGSSANTIGIEALALHGITESDVEFQYLNIAQQGDAMFDGLLDVGAYIGATPIPGIEGIAAREEVTIIPFDPEKLKNIREPLEGVELAAGTYTGQNDPITIIGMPAMLWFHADMTEQQVYEITKVVFENIEEIIAVDRIAEQMELYTKSEAEELDVEVHPGVIKYAQEIGRWE